MDGMKTIGLIGGMSWHSTAGLLPRHQRARGRAPGGHASAQIVLESLDFAEVRDCQVRGDWARAPAGCWPRRAQRCERVRRRRRADLHQPHAPRRRRRPGRHRRPARCTSPTPSRTARTSRGWSRARHARRPLGDGGGLLRRPTRRRGHDRRRARRRRPRRRRPHHLRRAHPRPGRGRARARRTPTSSAGSPPPARRRSSSACTEIELLVRPEDSPIPLLDSMRTHAEAAVAFALGDDLPTLRRAPRWSGSR